MSETPLISICIPNLNNEPFLEERLKSIYEQTYSNWELIVVDNHSDDGAWELFQAHAVKESRIRLSQAPKEGMYANWNNCIRLVKGEYVYIATSDDTLYSDFLEKMVAALEGHPECGLAHCNLHVIDEKGLVRNDDRWAGYSTGQYFGELLHLPHIRHAPHDGLLHYSGYTVYHSITQLLIRKKLLDKVGPFSNEFGSKADFGWEMKAALLSDCVHVPEYLATWRKHSAQATQPGSHVWSEHYLLEQAMISEAENWAIENSVTMPAEDLRKKLTYPQNRNLLISRLSEEKGNPLKLLKIFMKCAVSTPGLLADFLYEKIRTSGTLRYSNSLFMRSLLQHQGIEIISKAE